LVEFRIASKACLSAREPLVWQARDGPKTWIKVAQTVSIEGLKRQFSLL
jgi:hypothetical protein